MLGVKSTVLELAPFDILVSAATGGERAAGPFLSMDMEGYKRSFDKLWGYANVVRYGTEHLAADGSIVIVSGAPARRSRAHGQPATFSPRNCATSSTKYFAVCISTSAIA